MQGLRRAGLWQRAGLMATAAIVPAMFAVDGGAVARPDASYSQGISHHIGDEEGTRNAGLTSVSALSPNDVWIAGSRSDGSPMVRRYDGATWTTVGQIGADGLVGPTSMFALSDDDVWVSMYTEHYSRAAVAHWDGASWQQQDVPLAGRYDQLSQIWAASPTEVWAVGTYTPFGRVRPLIQHFDGVTWERARVPVPAGVAAQLYGVYGSSAEDVWAVGQHYRGGHWRTLILHWDGASWRVEDGLSGPRSSLLEDVNVVSPTDAWAVGWYSDDTTGQRGLIMHWDGTRWRDTHARALSNTYLYSVSTDGPDDVWTVGATIFRRSQVRSAHWDGDSWTRVPVDSPGRTDNYLYAVSADTPDDAWTVGAFLNDQVSHPMIQHWDGTRWSR